MMSPIFIALFAVISVVQATEYDIRVATSDIEGASTNANVKIKIHGELGITSAINLDYSGRNDFQQGKVDNFVYSAEDVGGVTGFEVLRDNFESYGVNPDWAFDYIGVKISSDPEYLEFTFGDWLPADTWVKFPRPYCGDVGHTCYFINDPCPRGTEICVQYQCVLATDHCCCNV